jgi:hypothetical protein
MNYKNLEINDKLPKHIKLRYMRQHDEALSLSKKDINKLKNES